MKTRIMLPVSLFLLSVLSLGFTQAFIPQVFVGDITYDGDPNLDLSIYPLTAKLNTAEIPIFGEYGGQIRPGNLFDALIGVPELNDGTIRFYVGNVEVFETFTHVPGTHQDVHLTIYEIPEFSSCGNGVLEGGEQCDGTDFGFVTCDIAVQVQGGNSGWTGDLGCNIDCEWDVSQCTEPANNDNSGGGSGGSGGGSGGSGGSSGGSSFQVNSGDDDTPNDYILAPSGETVNLNQDDDEENFAAPITGAVIGTYGKTGSILVIMILLLGLLTYVYLKQRNQQIAKQA